MAELDVWAAIRALKQQLDRLTSFEWPPYQIGTWTPAYTGLTVVGAVTHSGIYICVGSLVYIMAQITAGGGNTSASAGGGATFINNIPFTAAANSTLTVSDSAIANIGVGVVSGTTTNAYMPVWTARNTTIVISACYKK